MLSIDRPEVGLAGPEHDGDDVHPHLVDETRREHLATDVAGRDLDGAVVRDFRALASAASMPSTMTRG